MCDEEAFFIGNIRQISSYDYFRSTGILGKITSDSTESNIAYNVNSLQADAGEVLMSVTTVPYVAPGSSVN